MNKKIEVAFKILSLFYNTPVILIEKALNHAINEGGTLKIIDETFRKHIIHLGGCDRERTYRMSEIAGASGVGWSEMEQYFENLPGVGPEQKYRISMRSGLRTYNPDSGQLKDQGEEFLNMCDLMVIAAIESSQKICSSSMDDKVLKLFQRISQNGYAQCPDKLASNIMDKRPAYIKGWFRGVYDRFISHREIMEIFLLP